MDKTIKKLVCVLISILIFFYLSNLFPVIKSITKSVFTMTAPFFIGFFIAFLLNPLIRFLMRFRINHTVSVVIVFLSFIGLITLLVFRFLPLTIRQIIEFKNETTYYSQIIHRLITNISSRFNFEIHLPDVVEIDYFLRDNILIIEKKLSASLLKTMSSINLILITPITIYYFLHDYDKIIHWITSSLVKKQKTKLYSFLREFSLLLKSYFNGVLLVMIILIAVSTITFTIIGLQYPLLLGIFIGFTNIIPVIGQYIGGLIVALFALSTSVSLMVKTLIVVITLQLIETNFLTPFVQSKSQKTSPIVTILAFVIFSELFGFIGMVIAIPLASFIVLGIKYLNK